MASTSGTSDGESSDQVAAASEEEFVPRDNSRLKLEIMLADRERKRAELEEQLAESNRRVERKRAELEEQLAESNRRVVELERQVVTIREERDQHLAKTNTLERDMLALKEQLHFNSDSRDYFKSQLEQCLKASTKRELELKEANEARERQEMQKPGLLARLLYRYQQPKARHPVSSTSLRTVNQDRLPAGTDRICPQPRVLGHQGQSLTCPQPKVSGHQGNLPPLPPLVQHIPMSLCARELTAPFDGPLDLTTADPSSSQQNQHYPHHCTGISRERTRGTILRRPQSIWDVLLPPTHQPPNLTLRGDMAPSREEPNAESDFDYQLEQF